MSVSRYKSFLASCCLWHIFINWVSVNGPPRDGEPLGPRDPELITCTERLRATVLSSCFCRLCYMEVDIFSSSAGPVTTTSTLFQAHLMDTFWSPEKWMRLAFTPAQDRQAGVILSLGHPCHTQTPNRGHRKPVLPQPQLSLAVFHFFIF